MKNGTEWVEPGQGATVNELRAAIDRRHIETDADVYALDVLYHQDGRLRLNLRLTGEPLTAEDLKRIAVADPDHYRDVDQCRRCGEDCDVCQCDTEA